MIWQITIDFLKLLSDWFFFFLLHALLSYFLLLIIIYSLSAFSPATGTKAGAIEDTKCPA